MVLDYLHRSSINESVRTKRSEFEDLALSEAGYGSAESLDDRRSQVSV